VLRQGWRRRTPSLSWAHKLRARHRQGGRPLQHHLQRHRAVSHPAADGGQAKEQAFLESKAAKRQVSRYVIRRFGRANDVAGAALFLCSDAAGFITGQTYPVNGGYSFAV
jgi:NAD(P)-dependent dehydrogenase (short-subunit alcohol dehydrogenase family)